MQTAYIRLCMWMMRKHLRSGTRRWEFRQSVSLSLEKQIISGSMELVHVVHVLRSTMTAGRNTDAEARIVQLDVNVTDIWRFGTMYSLSLTTMDMEIILS